MYNVQLTVQSEQKIKTCGVMSYYCNTQGYLPPPLEASELYFMTSFSLITNLYSYNERLLFCTPQTYN